MTGSILSALQNAMSCELENLRDLKKFQVIFERSGSRAKTLIKTVSFLTA